MEPKEAPELDLLNDWLVRLFTSDDRSAIILACGAIEDSLEELLAAAIGLTNNKMFEYQKPLGTLSARISMCAALHLVDEHQRAALSTLRSVRNEAAHEKAMFAIGDGSKLVRLRD